MANDTKTPLPRSDYERARDHDLLIGLNQKMDSLTEKVDTLSEISASKDGFARCQVHKTQVEGLEKAFTRYRRIVYGILTVIATKLGLDWFGIFPSK